MDIREKLVDLLDDMQRSGTGYFGNAIENKKIADHLIANGVTVQEWISVKDGLPKDDSPVLVYKSRHSEAYGNMETAYYWNQRRWMGCIGETVTHWMPLPQPPKGE